MKRYIANKDSSVHCQPINLNLQFTNINEIKMKKTIHILLGFLTALSFSVHADRLEAKWSYAGKLDGKFRHCVAIIEPAEKKATNWHDNYLCFNKKKHGFKYSYDGRISGMNCASMDIKGGVWGDNFLCAKNRKFDFFQRNLPKGYRCIRVTEPSDPNPRANGTQGNSNHFCLKK